MGDITAEKIEEELAGVAFAPIDGKVKVSEKLKALELLGKCRGLFPSRVELTGKDGEAIQVDARVEGALEKIYGTGENGV